MQNSFVESHKNLLMQPDDTTLLYKVISFENFIKMLEGSYLHFNRVDNYTDDEDDSNQPEQERLINEKLFFEKDPNFTLRHYYEECRKRSYACCFSLDVPMATQWHQDGVVEQKKAVCLVMNFGKLKSLLNRTFKNFGLLTNSGIILQNHAQGIGQIFYLNYGLVKYGNFAKDFISPNIRPNPVEYLHFKDNGYMEKDGKELRISLFAIGIGKIVLPSGQLFDFPKSIPFEFNLNQALSCGAISHIEIADKNFLPELSKVLEEKKVVLKFQFNQEFENETKSPDAIG